MTKDQLVQQVKNIVALVRDNKLEEAYAGYRTLFADPGFIKNQAQDQRQALRLMIHARNAPHKPTPTMLEAHRAAVLPLTELVSAQSEPADFEMLGMCHVVLGNLESASSLFRAGLQIERERSPQSDLCGALMRRISEI